MRYIVIDEISNSYEIANREEDLLIRLLKFYIHMNEDEQITYLTGNSASNLDLETYGPLAAYTRFINELKFSDISELNLTTKHIKVRVHELEENGQISLF